MLSSSTIGGWVAGVVGCAAGYPFDTVKTLMQCDPFHYPGTLSATRRIAAEQGLCGFYRGCAVPLCGLGVIYAVGFASYDGAERALRWSRRNAHFSGSSAGHSGEKYANFVRVLCDALICGAFSGACMSLLMGPADLIKIQQQATLRHSRASALDSSLVSTLCRIYMANNQRGLRNFGTGLPATLARDVPGSAVWFTTYEAVRLACCADPSQPRPLESWLAGGSAGVVTWALVIPVDVAKTSQQSAMAAGGGNLHSATSVTHDASLLSIVKRLWRTEGIRSFYAGIGPALLRAFVANGATFAARDFVTYLLPMG